MTHISIRIDLRDRIFAAAEHVPNHPDNIASAIQTLLKHAENCLSTGGETSNSYCKETMNRETAATPTTS